jgi:hypothetical protein
MEENKFALWLYHTPNELFLLTVACASLLTLTISFYFLPFWRTGQDRAEHAELDNTHKPTVVQDQQKALYHMVKFSIRLKRKLKKIREQHSNQSLCSQ